MQQQTLRKHGLNILNCDWSSRVSIRLHVAFWHNYNKLIGKENNMKISIGSCAQNELESQ